MRSPQSAYLSTESVHLWRPLSATYSLWSSTRGRAMTGGSSCRDSSGVVGTDSSDSVDSSDVLADAFELMSRKGVSVLSDKRCV